MNKRCSDGRGSCKVHGESNTTEVADVVVTGIGDVNFLGKREGRVKDEIEILAGIGGIG